jgi:hypothetical protein
VYMIKKDLLIGDWAGVGQFLLIRCSSVLIIVYLLFCGSYLTQERCIYQCSNCKLHVWNGIETGVNRNCEGFVKTHLIEDGFHGVYAVDCEMSYIILGLEIKVTGVAGHRLRNFGTSEEHVTTTPSSRESRREI